MAGPHQPYGCPTRPALTKSYVCMYVCTTLYPGTASVCLKINKGLIFLTYTSRGVHDKNNKNSFLQKLLTRLTRVQKPYPISDQNGNNLYPISDQKGSKTILFGFGATHTYIAYVRE